MNNLSITGMQCMQKAIWHVDVALCTHYVPMKLREYCPRTLYTDSGLDCEQSLSFPNAFRARPYYNIPARAKDLRRKDRLLAV